MRLRKKLSVWTKEIVRNIHGMILQAVYIEPPAHYLGYTVAGKVPVILVPGILGKWSGMKPLGDLISFYGHPVYIVPELGMNIFSIPSSARKLHMLLARITPVGSAYPKIIKGAEALRVTVEKYGLHNAIIVAHSKGGLIGKYLLAHYNNDNRVLGVIAIATPFSGSVLAKLITHDSFRELRTDSEVITSLTRHTAVNHRIISLYPEYDTHVWADKGSYLKGAENIEVPVHGHVAVLFDKVMQKEVLVAIDRMTARA